MFGSIRYYCYIYEVRNLKQIVMKDEKTQILEAIKNASGVKGTNSMGVSESWYNAYYMVQKCFTEEQLKVMSTVELNNLIKLADFAGDVFY
jgi:hypothetical protein